MLEYPAILTCKDRSIWIINNVTVLYRTHALDMCGPSFVATSSMNRSKHCHPLSLCDFGM